MIISNINLKNNHGLRQEILYCIITIQNKIYKGNIMDFASAWAAGSINAELKESNELQREANAVASQRARENLRAEIIQELRNQGTLLPEYDWQSKEFTDALETIATDWYKRHPEVKRGTNDLAQKYPKVAEAQNVIRRMSQMGRITPVEYLTLLKTLFSF